MMIDHMALPRSHGSLYYIVITVINRLRVRDAETESQRIVVSFRDRTSEVLQPKKTGLLIIPTQY